VGNAVVMALIMTVTMPPILFIYSGHLDLDEPAVWIQSTVAGLGARRRGNFNLWSMFFFEHNVVTVFWFTSVN
jgi:hypothetical protein